MFTKESIALHNHFLSKLRIKNRKEYHLLYQFFQSINIVPIQKKSTYEVRSQTSIKSHPIQKFLGTSHFIHTNEKYTYSEINFKIKSINVTIYVYSKVNNPSTDFIDEIIKVIQYVASLSKVSIKKLTLIYYLNENQKKIHRNLQEITKNEINSGYCIQKENEAIITIYRIEEVMKVTIHELIHAFKYDSVQDNQQIINHYQEKYNISSKEINTHEAYTEVWANIINCYLISKRVQRRHQYNLFLILIEFEKVFSEYQTFKIFYLTQLSQKKIDINKYTNVLAYFVIREEILKRLPAFLKFCSTKNINYIHLKKEKDWFLFLKNNNTLSKRNNIFSNMNKKNYLFTTMRMSINELDIYACTNTPSLFG
tara:strand:- start:3706 stop:4809 length:1104 start_codon:yes stop_codon:yes gene_type:complete